MKVSSATTLLLTIIAISSVSVSLYHSKPKALAAEHSLEDDIEIGFKLPPNRREYPHEEQKYLAEDGHMHTVYWATGVHAPKMSSKKEELDHEGYFEKYIIKAGGKTYRQFRSPVKTGQGYYDLNKNIKSKHCYLGTAANMLHWWLEQNDKYVQAYIKHQEDKDGVYEQIEGNVPLKPDNTKKPLQWESVVDRAPIVIEDIEGLKRYHQPLYSDKLVTQTLDIYLRRHHEGYVSDMCIDHFLNGYRAIPVDGYPPQNKEYKFYPAGGGFFYPIFAMERLTTRDTTGAYERYRICIKDAFTHGYSVGLCFQAVGVSHAVTLWGAEYDDETGDLVRFFLTDTDDYDENTGEKPIPTVYGLSTFDVKKDGKAVYVSNDMDPNAQVGSHLQAFYTLDLAQDVWEAKMNDLGNPIAPKFLHNLNDYTYSTTAKALNLEVEVEKQDTGYITFQWYECDRDGSNPREIEREKKTWYKPDISNVGERFYYCEATNHKNGKRATGKTNVCRIFVDDTVLDAETPKYEFSPQYIKGYQFEASKALIVNSKVSDGGKLTYQWYFKDSMNYECRDGQKMEGETKSYLIPNTLQYSNSKFVYYCEVTNTNDRATGLKSVSYLPSKPIVYDLLPSRDKDYTFRHAVPPVVAYKTDTRSNEFNPGDDLELQIVAGSADGGSLTYQWYKNDQIMNGETLPTLKLHLALSGSTTYKCAITNTNNEASITKTSTIDEKITVNVKEAEIYLSSLSVENQVIYPGFYKLIYQYSCEVDSTVNSIKPVFTVQDPEGVSVKVEGGDNLVTGSNDVKIILEKAGTICTYLIVVYKSGEISHINHLKSLSVEGYKIAPPFSQDNLMYTLEVAHNVDNINVIFDVPEDSKARAYVSGDSGLKTGENKVVITVISEADEKREYVITVNKQTKPEKPDQPEPENPDKPVEPVEPAESSESVESVEPVEPVESETANENQDDNNNNESNKGDTDDQGYGTSTIVGIVAAVVVGIAAIVILAVFIIKKRKDKNRQVEITDE